MTKKEELEKHETYYILKIPELGLSGSKIRVKELLPILYFSLGTKKMAFKCMRISSAVMDLTKKPYRQYGEIGWYEYFDEDKEDLCQKIREGENMKVDLICKECGEHEQGNWNSYLSEHLIQNQLCFTCNFWYEKVKWKEQNNPKAVRIEGVHYFIGDDNEKGFRGFDGNKFIIRFHDGRNITTTNLWCQSSIPTRFRDRLPDNAIFLKEGLCQKISYGLF